MESKEKIMCLRVLEIMFCKCLLVDFKLMWNLELFKIYSCTHL